MELYTWSEKKKDTANKVGGKIDLSDETKLGYDGRGYFNGVTYSLFTYLNNQQCCAIADPGDDDALRAGDCFHKVRKKSDIEQIIEAAPKKGKDKYQLGQETRSRNFIIKREAKEEPRRTQQQQQTQAHEMSMLDVGRSLSQPVLRNDGDEVSEGFGANKPDPHLPLVPGAIPKAHEMKGKFHIFFDGKHQIHDFFPDVGSRENNNPISEVEKRRFYKMNSMYKTKDGGNDIIYAIQDGSELKFDRPRYLLSLPQRDEMSMGAPASSTTVSSMSGRKDKKIISDEIAKLHPTIQEDFKEWHDDPKIDTTQKRRALTFFKSAQAMDPKTSPYDYKKTDFMNVPIAASQPPYSEQTQNRSAGAAFYKWDINKLTNDALKEHITERNVKAGTRHDAGEQQTEESTNFKRHLGAKPKEISEGELAQIHPSIREDFKEWYNNPPNINSHRSRALPFFKSAQEINSDTSPYAYTVKDFVGVPFTNTKIQSSGIAFLKYDLSKLSDDEFKKYVNDRQVGAKTRSDDAEKQRTEEPASQSSSSAIPPQKASEAMQIASDETYARQIREKEDASEVLSSEEIPRDRGLQGEPLPKARKSEAGNSGLHTGLSKKLGGITAGESASGNFQSPAVFIEPSEHYVTLIKSMHAIKTIDPENYQNNSTYKEHTSDLNNLLRREKNNGMIDQRLVLIKNAIQKDDNYDGRVAILNKCIDNLVALTSKAQQELEGEVSSVQPQGIPESPKSPIRADDDLSDFLDSEEERSYIMKPSEIDEKRRVKVQSKFDKNRSASEERDPYLGVSGVLGGILRDAGNTQPRRGARETNPLQGVSRPPTRSPSRGSRSE